MSKSNVLETRDIDDFGLLKFLEFYLLGHKGFIAGGCFKNIFSGEKIKDIDIFFESKREFEVAKKIYVDDERYTKEYENDNAICFKDNKNDVLIELITSRFGTPEKIINDFDFTITKFCIFREYDEGEDNHETKVMHLKLFFEHLHLKRLVVEKEGSLIFPEGTFNRMCKYIKYGFIPCRGTKVRIIEELQSSDNNPESVEKSLYNGID